MKKNSSVYEKPTVETAIISALVIIFFVSIVLMYYNMLFEEKKDNIIKDCRWAAHESAVEFEKYLTTNSDIIDITAAGLDEMLAEGRSEDEIQAYLTIQSAGVKGDAKDNSTGLYGYIDGRFYSGTGWDFPEDYDATVRPWYTNPMKNKGQISLLEPYEDVQSGNTMLAIGKTLSDGKSVISVDVSLANVSRMTREAVSSGRADLEMIVNEKGVVVAHSDEAEAGSDYSEETDTLGAAIYSCIKGHKDSSYEIEYGGATYIVYVALLANDWKCISVTDTTEIYGSLHIILTVTIGVIMAIVLIISFIMAASNRNSIMAERANAANEAKNVFLANMSHELRTPINAVLGMNEMILRESRDADIMSYSENIRAAGLKLLGFVDEILEFSKDEKTMSGIESYDMSSLSFEKFSEKEEKEKEGFVAPDARILVTDDNVMNLIVFKDLIKRTMSVVDTADNGDEAIGLSKENKYDIIFMDHMMPQKDGIETLREIKEDPSNPNAKTPVVCLTANAVPGAREQYISEGFDDYMTKPIDPDRFDEIMLTFLPADLVHRVAIDNRPDLKKRLTIPDELLPIKESGLVDVETGLKNSGGAVDSYISLLRVYYESMDDISRELDNYFLDENWTDYIIRVHALKSSSRIIGAVGLGEEAQQLENAGKTDDTHYIMQHHNDFIKDYLKIGQPLSRLFESDEDDADLPVADEKLLNSFYSHLAEAAADMDCDGLEEAFDMISGYSVPEEDAELFAQLKESSSRFEYDVIVDLIGKEE